ncbi:MAG: hypothetical protein KAX15_08380 [Candidatus Omnitrophica bacterium]|nr:hypothetical protein [Candidatus Omnitrophota bacterium]
MGKRINTEILKGKRAEYGEDILPTLSTELTPMYGEGFKERILARMIKFYECSPWEKIVATLSQ